MTDLGRTAALIGLVVALMATNAAAEYVGRHPIVGLYLIATAALTATARLIYTTGRPQ